MLSTLLRIQHSISDGYDPSLIMDGHLTPEYIDENGVHG